jgi:uncharacterized protein (TIGR02271 family)
MINMARVREGMPVYDADNRYVGPVQRLDTTGMFVNGQHFGHSAIRRVERDKIYLHPVRPVLTPETPDAPDAPTEPIPEVVTAPLVEQIAAPAVPVMEERLRIEKRVREIGEVRVHKRVTEHSQRVTLPVMQESLEVRYAPATTPRPPTEAELADAFQERTIRIPVRGEQPAIEKQPVVTREVVIHKRRRTEQRDVTGTVRRSVASMGDAATTTTPT